jgi:hypothetical protein
MVKLKDESGGIDANLNSEWGDVVSLSYLRVGGRRLAPMTESGEDQPYLRVGSVSDQPKRLWRS